MTYIANVLNVDRHFVELVWLKLRSIRRQINSPRLPSVTVQHHVQLGVRVQDLSKAKTNCTDKVVRVKLLILLRYTWLFARCTKSNLHEPKIIVDKIKVEKTTEEINRQGTKIINTEKDREGKRMTNAKTFG